MPRLPRLFSRRPQDVAARAAPDLDAEPAPAAGAERRPASRLIGGEEDDIVPVIPDTDVEFSAPASDFDEEAAMEAAVDALWAACAMMVERVKTLRTLQD